MSNIKYTIEFYSQWHCGSGLSAGADVDALVVKDKDDMPYVPGKTIKGLVREAVENLMQFTRENKSGLIEQAFGEGGKTTGCAHFGNAELDTKERDAIVKANAAQFLYNKVTPPPSRKMARRRTIVCVASRPWYRANYTAKLRACPRSWRTTLSAASA